MFLVVTRYVPPVNVERTGRIRPLDVNIGFDNFEILKIDDADFTVEERVTHKYS